MNAWLERVNAATWLQPGDECQAVLVGRLAASTSISSAPPASRSHLLALIRHPLANSSKKETATQRPGEACLMRLRSGEDGLRLERLWPVLPSLAIHLVQPVASDPGPAAELEINVALSGFSSLRLVLDAACSSIATVQLFLASVKKYQSAIMQRTETALTHGWIERYLAGTDQQRPISSRSSTASSSLARPTVSEAKSSNPFLFPARERLSTDPANQLALPSGIALRTLKDRWIANQLKDREQDFVNKRDVSMFVGTWNVNGRLSAEDLSPWLLAHRSKLAPCPAPSDPDIFVVGFQEMDLSAEALLLNDSPREDYWSVAIENGLKELAGRYRKLASKSLVGLLIVIYIRCDLETEVNDLATDSAGCGIMGMLGNKGGVSVRFRLFDSIFCFVNSHLAADSKDSDRRNQDYLEISRRLSFSKPGESRLNSIWDCDHLVWFGDLNYRIPLAESDVKEMLNSRQDYSALLELDQLTTERRLGRAFAEFEEHPVNFCPSYKYDPGTSTFDTSEKRRAPSWCDRVLYRKGDDTRVVMYTSVMSLMTSDHKPVMAILRTRAKTIDLDRRQIIHQSILRDLDKFENESMPDASISSNSLEFDNVYYQKPQTRSILLENTGKVLAQFRFIPKLDDKHFCRPWLWVNPPMSMLLPGEKIQVNFTILVDRNSAPALNIGQEKLEDILILHLENGKDYFVTISGSYQRSCFGLPLDMLALFTVPIRQLDTLDVPKNHSSASQAPLNIPKELWRIVDYIFHFGLGVEGLFLSSGDSTLMEQIRECLDTGTDFPVPAQTLSSSQEWQLRFIHSMCETLVRFLEALPTPVIPHGHLYQKCMDSYQSFELSQKAIASLPPIHYNVFLYVTSFLREILSVQHDADLTEEKLALIFSTVLLRSPRPVVDKYSDLVARRKTGFLLHFLRAAPD